MHLHFRCIWCTLSHACPDCYVVCFFAPTHSCTCLQARFPRACCSVVLLLNRLPCSVLQLRSPVLTLITSIDEAKSLWAPRPTCRLCMGLMWLPQGSSRQACGMKQAACVLQARLGQGDRGSTCSFAAICVLSPDLLAGL